MALNSKDSVISNVFKKTRYHYKPGLDYQRGTSNLPSFKCSVFAFVFVAKENTSLYCVVLIMFSIGKVTIIHETCFEVLFLSINLAVQVALRVCVSRFLLFVWCLFYIVWLKANNHNKLNSEYQRVSASVVPVFTDFVSFI